MDHTHFNSSTLGADQESPCVSGLARRNFAIKSPMLPILGKPNV